MLKEEGDGSLKPYIILASVLLFDQFSKVIVRNTTAYSVNTGTVFGLLQGNNLLFIIITVAVIAALLYYYRKLKEKSILNQSAIALITGGALSNLIDRVVFGGVIDYIDLKFWPSFNIADAALVAGMTIFFIGMKKK